MCCRAQNRIVPIFAHGVACVSVGLLVRPERAAVWRGPMVSSALDKMARGTAWKDRQVLIVDLPPGTGDAQARGLGGGGGGVSVGGCGTCDGVPVSIAPYHPFLWQ